jgi:cytochrome P450
LSPANETINLFAPEVRADPYPTYAALRQHHPVCPVEPGGFWAISRYADVIAVLKSAERFSSAGFRPVFEPAWLGHNPGAHTMLSMDPPEHSKKRSLVNRVFSPASVTRTEPAIRARIARLTDRLAEQGACEFIGDFATPLTSGVIGDFLALDPSIHSKFKSWSDAMSSVTPVPLSDQHAETVRSTIKEMEDYFGSVIDERKRSPGEDIVSRLSNADIDGQSLSREELIAFLFLLVVAGLETTVHLISKSIITLSDRPALVAQLRTTPALIPRFIEEMLRYDPPTHNLFRQATEDSEIAGVRVPAGTFVMVMLASANRDPDQFPDPDRFDLERASQGGIAFGHGAHFCLGAVLARLEARATLESLLARFKHIEREPGAIEWQHTLTVRGPARLPVRVTPA